MSRDGVLKKTPDPLVREPRPRVVVLGASNVSRCISTIVETAQAAAGGPIDLFAAFGHGRSLGIYSRVLGRGICGLLDAGIWKALAAAPEPSASFALLTDIGNDLVYEVPLPRIAAWIDECLARCQSVAQKILVTELPLASIARLDARRYAVLRRVIFPQCRLTLAQVREGAEALNAEVHEAARRRGATVVAPEALWYGLDPIHIRRGAFAPAWNSILRNWNARETALPMATGSLRRWLYLRGLAPEKRAYFGIERTQPQPAGRLTDGSTISFF